MQRRDIRYQAAVVHNHHVLLLHIQDRETGETYWIFPGGGREANETPEECVRRELQEETGLDVAVLKLLFTVADIPAGMYDWLATYHCQILSGIAHPGVEPEIDDAEYTTIQAVAWFDLRTPATWEAAVTQDPITFPLLQRLCFELGYA